MLRCYANIQAEEKLEQHQKSCGDHYHVVLQILQKFKTILNMKTDEMKEVAGNILKHSLQNKSLKSPFIVACDVETMFLDKDNQLKLRKLRKSKDNSFAVKAIEHLPIGFVLTVHYLKIYSERKIKMILIDDPKIKYNEARVFCLGEKKIYKRYLKNQKIERSLSLHRKVLSCCSFIV